MSNTAAPTLPERFNEAVTKWEKVIATHRPNNPRQPSTIEQITETKAYTT